MWINRTSPEVGFPAEQFYGWAPFGTWILFAEIVLFGLVPAVILLLPKMRARRGWLVSAAALACCGVTLNRFVQTVQTLALPTLPFDKFLSYYAELAGGRDVSGGGRVRRAGLFVLVPLLQRVPAGAGADAGRAGAAARGKARGAGAGREPLT